VIDIDIDMLCWQSERQELNGSRQRLDAVVAEARRLTETYHTDDTSKISADIELITLHWQQLLDRSVTYLIAGDPTAKAKVLLEPHWPKVWV